MATNYVHLVLVFLFVVGGLSFSLNKSHLLASLISLEYMVMILFMVASLTNPGAGVTGVALAFLAVSVCEGALGLSVLVTFARAFGGESLSALVTVSW